MLKQKVMTSIISYLFFSITVSLLFVSDNKMYGDLFYITLIVGAYSLPFFLFCGVPSTLFVSYLTKGFSGIIKGGLSLVIHLLLGMLIVMILYFVFINKSLFNDLKSFWSESFIFSILTLYAAFLVWLFDEMVNCNFIRSKRSKIISRLDKYMDLRI